jgi:hypothetical protein
MTYLAAKWIQGFRRINETSPPSKFLVDADSFPALRDFTLPTSRLARKINLTLEILRLSPNLHLKFDASEPLDRLAEDISSRASHITEAAISLQQEVMAYSNVQVTRANLRESRAIKRLAVLATAFLPLSLGASVLSMQNRLRNVHLILWDYVAVSIDLGVVVLFLFWITGPSKLPRLGPWFSKNVLFIGPETFETKLKVQVRRIVWRALTMPIFAMIIVAVNVGMFGSVEVGWKILGYGVAGVVGLFVLGGILYVAFSFLWYVFDEFDNWVLA